MCLERTLRGVGVEWQYWEIKERGKPMMDHWGTVRLSRSFVVFNLYPTFLHKRPGQTTEEFGLYYKDHGEPVNNFHPKNDRLRHALWKGQPASLGDGLERSELIRSLLVWCREEMTRDWTNAGQRGWDEKLLRGRMESPGVLYEEDGKRLRWFPRLWFEYLKRQWYLCQDSGGGPSQEIRMMTLNLDM